MRTLILAGVVGLSLGLAFSSAGVTNTFINVVIDPNGDGYIGLPNGQTVFEMMPYSTTTPDPFALANPSNDQYGNAVGTPLSYSMPSSWTITVGDIRLNDPSPSTNREAVVRFTPGAPTNTMFLYASDHSGSNALADVGVPKFMQGNVANFTDESLAGLMPSGLGVSGMAIGYVFNATSSANPGFITGMIDGYNITGVNYYIIAEGTVFMVPEPCALALGGLGAGVVLVGSRRWRRS